MDMKRVAAVRAGLRGGSALLLSMAVMGSAMAQEPIAEDGGAIVVTGSRIPRPDVESNSPVNVIGQDEIKYSATVETEQLLNALPQAVAGAGAQSNSGNGSATVNLRNLGAVRTLVLQNGRRIVGASQDGVVDLNMIPPSLVQRVEVVTGGASAVYGSDAMAGVVNFVTKDDFEGFEIGGSYGLSDEGDAERYNVDLTVGGNFADGRGNIVFHGSYYDRAMVKGAARDHAIEYFADAIVDGKPVLVPAGNGVTPQGTIFSPQLVGLTDPYGNTIGTAGIFFADEGWRAYRTSDGFNDRPFTNIQMPMQRWQGSVIGHYDVTDDVTAFWEGSYVHSKINSTLGAVPMSSSGFIPGFQLDIRNPYLDPTLRDFLSTNMDADGDSLVPVNINRRLLDGGSRTSDQTRDFYRFVVGLKGDLTDRLKWEVFYNQGETKVTDVQGGGVLIDNFANGFLTDPNDPYKCAIADADCVVLNPFGLNSLTPDMINYIYTDLTNITTIRQKQVGASLTGSLFTLPAGDVGISIGGEYRKESSAFDPDQLYVQGKALSRSAGLSPTAGSFDVAELYGELYVPILADMPGVELLAFEGGLRFSDYSTAGSVWSYKLGGEYSPFRGLKFRGLYQRAVRAPNVVELFSGATNTAPQALDFCNAGPDRTQQERDFCVNSLGIPAAVIDVFQQENQQIRAITGGNPNLQEETSDTWSVGAVIRPEFIPNLQLTVDYYNIKIDDAIGSFGGGLQAVITACNSDLSLDNIFCQPLRNRTPDGQLYDVPLLNANIAKLEASGIDYRLDYRHSLGSVGSLSYYISGTYLIDAITQGSPIVNPVNCAGYIGGGSCSTANPKWRFTQRLTWEMDKLQLSLRHRFIGSTKDGRIAGAKASGAATPLLAVPETGDVHYFDLGANVDVRENFSLFANVDNLFDRDPPFYLYERETYDAIGRRFTIGFRANF
ncbi:TonB-dependent receptor [Sphingopyxis sp. PAMC25046]|uniref:TonB-dependent receptor domain-containing protein n=1 Tax=Sphingopyxis sp. PAMC25046 TaxID=2565556 RepID=UPI00109E03C2|nr:TonB-dependent receptor [Sphingopyxis sp. PAMC25046]QCB56170.1 TonB-dependent receptor [Sphingopyxis sp. PAMC25046]